MRRGEIVRILHGNSADNRNKSIAFPSQMGYTVFVLVSDAISENSAFAYTMLT